MNPLYDIHLLIITICISASAQWAYQKDCQVKMEKCLQKMEKNEATFIYCLWAKEHSK